MSPTSGAMGGSVQGKGPGQGANTLKFRNAVRRGFTEEQHAHLLFLLRICTSWMVAEASMECGESGETVRDAQALE